MSVSGSVPGFITHQPESTGKKVETVELTGFDPATGKTITVQRQIVIGAVEITGPAVTELLEILRTIRLGIELLLGKEIK